MKTDNDSKDMFGLTSEQKQLLGNAWFKGVAKEMCKLKQKEFTGLIMKELDEVSLLVNSKKFSKQEVREILGQIALLLQLIKKDD